jgi:hypothetical protein
MLEIFDPTLLCPLCAAFSGRLRKICAFGKDQQPHGEIYFVEFLKMLSHS